MFTQSRKFLLITLFTLLVVALVNFVWWANYDKTEQLLEVQLAKRLASVVSHLSLNLDLDLIYGVMEGDLDSFDQLTQQLENGREADSLAELFLLARSYRYLASTEIEPDSLYFLADLHASLIDSLFYTPDLKALVGPTYRSGQVYLKSAFAPVIDPRGNVVALLGAEASVDYFDEVAQLRENLYLSTYLSLAGGLLAGAILIGLQLRINRAESAAFLSQTEAFLGRMVSVVAHEIRNPLAIIRGSGERLKSKTNSEEAEFIIEEADRLDRILTDYLEFAKGGKSILASEQPEQIDLPAFFARIKNRFETEFESDRIRWTEFDIEGSLTIIGYKHALYQVIYNLLLNGAQACQSVGREIGLGLSCSSQSHQVQILVSDIGPGLSRRQLKNLFTPFFTTKTKGSGLGLYLSRNIAREMGGDLTLAKAKSGGLEAKLSLPLTPTEPEAES